MDNKECKKCGKSKALTDFYIVKGRCLSKCKKCTIKDNYKHQKATRSWENKVVDKDARREYMKVYYANNKDKMIEHRKKFLENNPDYYKEYARNKKLKPV